jgi:hypothetical protein
MSAMDMSAMDRFYAPISARQGLGQVRPVAAAASG